MEYSLLDKGTKKHVVFYGNIVPSSRAKFLEMAKNLQTSEQKQWVLEVDELDYIDSAGLGMFIEFNEKAQESGISVALSGAQGVVKRMFELSKFNELFEIVD
ncbi:STAS domain-containing protein [Terasakiella sp. A23]|uniref:STAS domain-containing protein n=1 Tax=Terasakiella sp. FCG-A23 TaxID=3080561 RepID=UPI0029530987|nr:STAS domain-containing protein [Terasakiella sp. A23]MDV7340195.1 STAS domain-containing protein [Terasakiella sp. A23]